MEPEELALARRALMNRQSYQQKNYEAALSGSEQQYNAAITRYEASNGLMQVTDSTGSSFYARAITNGATGKGETVRLRTGGANPTFDSMPCTRKTTTTAITKSIQIIFGILVTFEYYSDTNFDLDPPEVDPYPYTCAPINTGYCTTTGFCMTTNFCIGVINGDAVSITYLFPSTNIPALKRFTVYPNNNQVFETVVIASYYSMAYSKNILNYIDGGASTQFNSSGQANYDYGSIMSQVVSITANQQNPAQSKLTVKDISLATTGTFEVPRRNPTSPTPTIQISTLNGDTPISFCLKYKSSDGSIKFVLISALKGGAEFDSAVQAGIIIWDLGKINEIDSRNNPACYFGFTWICHTSYGYPSTGIRTNGGYGATGGIVLDLVANSSDLTNSADAKQFTVFVSEKHLTGQENNQLNIQDLLFDKSISFQIANPDFSSTNVNSNVGAMPNGLENRDTFYQFSKTTGLNGILLKTQLPGNSDTFAKRLMAWSVFDKDKGKQIFS